jgi:ketosteroid isomerase-like protein
MDGTATGPGAALVERMFAASRSLDEYVSFFAEDALYRYGNNPPVRGHQGLKDAMMRLRQGVQRVTHEMKGMWESGDVVVCEMEVTYTRQDGRTVTLPCCDTFRINGDKIQEMRVYVDATPVYA